MRFDVCGVDHLRVRRAPTPGQLPEQVFPDAAPCPAHKAIIDRHVRAVFRRAIAPATTAFQDMNDAADNPPIIDPLDAPHIGRQMRRDPSPLFVAQPKQIAAHDPDPLQNESGQNGIRIVLLQHYN